MQPSPQPLPCPPRPAPPPPAAPAAGSKAQGEESCFFLRLEVRKAGMGWALAQRSWEKRGWSPEAGVRPPSKVACPSNPLLWWPRPVSPWSPRCPFSRMLIPIKSFCSNKHHCLSFSVGELCFPKHERLKARRGLCGAWSPASWAVGRKPPAPPARLHSCSGAEERGARKRGRERVWESGLLARG